MRGIELEDLKRLRRAELSKPDYDDSYLDYLDEEIRKRWPKKIMILKKHRGKKIIIDLTPHDYIKLRKDMEQGAINETGGLVDEDDERRVVDGVLLALERNGIIIKIQKRGGRKL